MEKGFDGGVRFIKVCTLPTPLSIAANAFDNVARPAQTFQGGVEGYQIGKMPSRQGRTAVPAIVLLCPND